MYAEHDYSLLVGWADLFRAHAYALGRDPPTLEAKQFGQITTAQTANWVSSRIFFGCLIFKKLCVAHKAIVAAGSPSVTECPMIIHGK